MYINTTSNKININANIIDIKTETFKENNKPYLNMTLILNNGLEINIPKIKITGLETSHDLFTTECTLKYQILSHQNDELFNVIFIKEEEEEDWKKCYEQYLSENEVK